MYPFWNSSQRNSILIVIFNKAWIIILVHRQLSFDYTQQLLNAKGIRKWSRIIHSSLFSQIKSLQACTRMKTSRASCKIRKVHANSWHVLARQEGNNQTKVRTIITGPVKRWSGRTIIVKALREHGQKAKMSADSGYTRKQFFFPPLYPPLPSYRVVNVYEYHAPMDHFFFHLLSLVLVVPGIKGHVAVRMGSGLRFESTNPTGSQIDELRKISTDDSFVDARRSGFSCKLAGESSFW